jgi:phage protein U
MYAQLGTLVFEGIFGMQSLPRSRGVRYTDITLADGKPRKQRNGIELDTIQIDVRFHSGFGATPQTQINLLTTWQNTGEVLPLIDGQGNNYGNFVIEKITDIPEIVGVTGEVISSNVSIQLSEYVDSNPAATTKRQNIQNGFATDPLKVIPISVTRKGTTPASVTSTEAKEAAANAAGSASDIAKVVTAPAQKPSLFQSAKSKAQAAAAGARASIARIQDVTTIAARAPQLLTALQAVRDNADLMVTRIAEGDLTNALYQAKSLDDSSRLIDAALKPLDILLVTKQAI